MDGRSRTLHQAARIAAGNGRLGDHFACQRTASANFLVKVRSLFNPRAELKIKLRGRRPARKHRALRIETDVAYSGVVTCDGGVGARSKASGGGDEI